MKKDKVVMGLGLLVGVTEIIVNEFKKKERLTRLEEAVSGLIFTQESMLTYQAEKNENFEDKLENLVEEIGSVYEHFEYLNEK